MTLHRVEGDPWTNRFRFTYDDTTVYGEITKCMVPNRAPYDALTDMWAVSVYDGTPDDEYGQRTIAYSFGRDAAEQTLRSYADGD